jgi:hypothetical protein
MVGIVGTIIAARKRAVLDDPWRPRDGAIGYVVAGPIAVVGKVGAITVAGFVGLIGPGVTDTVAGTDICAADKPEFAGVDDGGLSDGEPMAVDDVVDGAPP